MTNSKTYKIIIAVLSFVVASLVFMLGVTAITNAKKVQFNLSTQYAPEVYVGVDMKVDSTYKQIFSSQNPTEVNYNAYYIESVSSDTINLKNESLFIENGAVNLKLYNHDTRYKVYCYINNSGDPITLAKPTSVSAPTIAETSVTVGEAQLGLILISLRFQAVQEVEISYSTFGATKTTAPTVVLNGESATITLQAEHEDYTKWTITANGTPIIPTLDWATEKMTATFTVNNITADTQISATAEIDYWDGSIATAFAVGSGTETDPYVIRNGAQLAFINSAVLTSGTNYVKLLNNIYLNDETFTNLKNGYVEVTDGLNTAYVCDGSNGTSYQNTGNYVMGQWYSNQTGSTLTPIISTLSSGIEKCVVNNLEINIWVPLKFSGVFQGNEKIVYGIFMNNDKDYQSFFAESYNQSLITCNYLTIKESYIKCLGYGAAFVSDGPVSFNYCINYATVCGSDNYVAGIYAFQMYSGNISYGYNYGVIVGKNYIGGITGYSSPGYRPATNCVNKGVVLGVDYVGGVVGCGGHLYATDCVNEGLVYGTGIHVGNIYGYFDEP